MQSMVALIILIARANATILEKLFLLHKINLFLCHLSPPLHLAIFSGSPFVKAEVRRATFGTDQPARLFVSVIRGRENLPAFFYTHQDSFLS